MSVPTFVYQMAHKTMSNMLHLFLCPFDATELDEQP